MRGGLADLLHGAGRFRKDASTLCGGLRRCGPHGVDGASVDDRISSLTLPSNALVKNGSLGEPPLLRAVASELFADDFAAQRIADKLFKNNGGGDRPPKRGWRYVGDRVRKHAKRDNKENLDAASKARAARRTPVFLRVQEAGRSRERLICSRGTLASMWARVPSAARLAKRCHSFKRRLPRNRTMF